MKLDKLALILLLLFSPLSIFAQKQYEGIPFAPYEFYEALLVYDKEGNLDGISRLLKHLKPLLHHLYDEFGTDWEREINQGIRKRTAEKVRAAILKLIFTDMRSHLTAANRAKTRSQRKKRLYMAYTNYAFLSPTISRKDKKLDLAIRKTFRDIYRSKDKTFISKKAKWLLTALSKAIFQEESNENQTLP